MYGTHEVTLIVKIVVLFDIVNLANTYFENVAKSPLNCVKQPKISQLLLYKSFFSIKMLQIYFNFKMSVLKFFALTKY